MSSQTRIRQRTDNLLDEFPNGMCDLSEDSSGIAVTWRARTRRLFESSISSGLSVSLGCAGMLLASLVVARTLRHA